MVVNTLYDKAIHLSDEEFEIIHGKKIDVQGGVEKPDVYILARCPSDEHQLMYSNIRNEDIRLLKYPINVEGYQLHDEVRFFHGDGPACETGADQQKNGNYPCWLCPANFNFSNKLEYLHSLPNLDLKDRTEKILKSVASQEKIISGKIKLYSNLRKQQIVDELHEHGVKFTIESKKDVLEQKLIEEMHGMQRLPSLIHADKIITPFLTKYEILGCEPL